MRTAASQTGRRIAFAIFCALPAALAAAPAWAHEIAAAPEAATLDLPPAAAVDGDNPPAPQLSPEDSAFLGSALQFDPAQFSGGAAKPLRRPGPTIARSNALDMARTDRPDGTSTVTMKKPLAPGWSEWDAKVGADLGLAADAPNAYGPVAPLPAARSSSGSGAAWASLGVPKLATVDARVDPGNELGRLGTTVMHSVPVGGKFAVTLQSSYSVTETFGQPQTSSANVPLLKAPATAAAEPMPQVWGNANSAKLDILPTGTTLAAGLSSTSIDPVTHNRLSAEQQLYGPLSVTTAVNDVGQAGESKSISARFKLNW